MEMKTGQLTSREAQRASNEHFEAESEIMQHVKNMTLAGKKQLAKNMPQHVDDAEEQSEKMLSTDPHDPKS